MATHCDARVAPQQSPVLRAGSPTILQPGRPRTVGQPGLIRMPEMRQTPGVWGQSPQISVFVPALPGSRTATSGGRTPATPPNTDQFQSRTRSHVPPGSRADEHPAPISSGARPPAWLRVSGTAHRPGPRRPWVGRAPHAGVQRQIQGATPAAARGLHPPELELDSPGRRCSTRRSPKLGRRLGRNSGIRCMRL